jgi:uncharacterized protein YbjT (DUF2867 family)
MKGDVLFAGSSGMIGSLALPMLLARAADESRRVIAPVRRKLEREHATLRTVIGSGTDVDAGIAAAAGEYGIDVYVCALGTTIGDAGSQQAFAAIDHDLVLHYAALAQRHGARHAVVVSSIGADAGASNFYLRTKGRMERDVSGLGFERCDFLQPGLLLGDRAGRHRHGEAIGRRLAPLFNPLLLGPLRRYRAVEAEIVARALVALTTRTEPGAYRHGYDALRALAV